MGMFDEIICRYPLPTPPPTFCMGADHRYQSKSLGCEMAVYEITEHGGLRQTQNMFEVLDKPETVPFHGTVEFYDGNCATAYLGMCFTAHGEDHESVTYEAIFVEGVVKQIVETDRTKETALSCADLAECEARSDKDAPEVDTSEPEVGAKMYLQWGGSAKGYSVTLIAKTDRQYVVVKDGGNVDTLHSGDIGRLLFHTQEESDRLKAWGESAFENKMACVQKMLEQKLNVPAK